MYWCITHIPLLALSLILLSRQPTTRTYRRSRSAFIELEKIHELPLWEGDRHFLPLIFDADPRPFHGVMPYRDGRMVSWSFSRI